VIKFLWIFPNGLHSWVLADSDTAAVEMVGVWWRMMATAVGAGIGVMGFALVPMQLVSVLVTPSGNCDLEYTVRAKRPILIAAEPNGRVSWQRVEWEVG